MEMDITKEELKKEIVLTFTCLDLFNVTANMILALKHPENNGPSAVKAYELTTLFVNILYNLLGDKLPVNVLDEWKRLGFLPANKVN